MQRYWKEKSNNRDKRYVLFALFKTAQHQLLLDVVNALLTNFCGKTNRKEQAFQSCLKTTSNKVPIGLMLSLCDRNQLRYFISDVTPSLLKIDFTKWTPLKDIVTEVEYGKIAVGKKISSVYELNT